MSYNTTVAMQRISFGKNETDYSFVNTAKNEIVV